jgi:HAD superfamily hydrolase (TIGR01549 family)
MVVRALVFDLFDTLVDLFIEKLAPMEHRGRRISATAPVLHRALAAHAEVGFDAFAEALAHVDREVLVPRYREGRELSTLERFGSVCARLRLADPALPALLTDVHMQALREQVAVPAHHPALLGELAARVPIAVCSNFSHSETARRILEEGGMAACFRNVVVSEDLGVRKPRAEIFRAALAGLDARPEEVLHVGDSLAADVAGAAGLGIRTVWLTRRVADPARAREAYEGPPPQHEIRDLAELPPLLDGAPGTGGEAGRSWRRSG